MMGSFTLVSSPGKKICLEKSRHPCPKCKHNSSVQLIRSEKQWKVFNINISNVLRVRYECSNCNWKNQELPLDDNNSSIISPITSSTNSSYLLTY